MTTQAVTLVPRRSDGGRRDELWEYVQRWWRDVLPELPLVEGQHDDGPFNRSAAINAAAREAGDWDVAFIIDADVLMDPRQVRAAIAVAAGTGGPCLAYHERCHLSRAGSDRILAGYQGDWGPLVKTRYTDSCSSAYAVTREVFDAVGGFDELFVGWGWEDVAFRCATEVIADRELVKIAGPLWHLWHVVSSGNNPLEATFRANRARGERYNVARHAWDLPAMTKLVDEHVAAREQVPA